MGNCLRPESSMQWGGDDWSSLGKEGFSAKDTDGDSKGMKMKEEGLLGDDQRGFSSSSATKTTEIKIKITKKQLEKLLGMVDIKELSVQQVLAQLKKASDRYETHQRSWRPALKSIPEVN